MKTLTVITRWLPAAFLLTLLSACGPDNNNSSTASFTVTASATAGGKISPASQTVSAGDTATFTVTAGKGNFVDAVSGCGEGTLVGDTYTTGTINADCHVSAVFNPPTPRLSFAPVKLLHFEWTDAPGATHYRLLENPDGKSGFKNQISGDIKPGVQAYDHQVPLYARVNARYILRSCIDAITCYDSAPVLVSGTLVNSIGYIKASNADGKNDGSPFGDFFGYSLSLNATGDTLAVGADGEDSSAVGIDGDQSNATNDFDYNAGAVYVFTREGNGVWTQQAYIKASNTGNSDRFGSAVSLDNSGNTLAVGAHGEDSGAKGVEGTDINGDQYDNLDGDQGDDVANASAAGAVYVFTRDSEGAWSQQAYIKASNSDAFDDFGWKLSLSGNGDTLAVGVYNEDSAATGIDHSADDDEVDNDNLDQGDNSVAQAGAVYVFTRSGEGVWSQQAYIKASNTGENDYFGWSVSLDDTGDTLAVGAYGEDSPDTGVHTFPFDAGNENSEDDPDSGAVYVFTRNGEGVWSQQAYIKASNPGSGDWFGGGSLSLSGNGDTLAVAAPREGSAATGINGDQNNNDAPNSGAVYVFTRLGCSSTPWCQQAYIKASNTEAGDRFGTDSLSLNGSGDTLAVAAAREDSAATGINGDQSDNSAENSGAVYLFTRSAGVWSQQAYIKASNTEGGDSSSSCGNYDAPCGDALGWSVSLDSSGDTLAVGAFGEDSNATGIDGDQSNNDADFAGAVYLY